MVNLDSHYPQKQKLLRGLQNFVIVSERPETKNFDNLWSRKCKFNLDTIFYLSAWLSFSKSVISSVGGSIGSDYSHTLIA